MHIPTTTIAILGNPIARKMNQLAVPIRIEYKKGKNNPIHTETMHHAIETAPQIHIKFGSRNSHAGIHLGIELLRISDVASAGLMTTPSSSRKVKPLSRSSPNVLPFNSKKPCSFHGVLSCEGSLQSELFGQAEH